MAYKDYAAFNIAWAIHRPVTQQDHLTAIATFVHQQKGNEQVVDGAELGSWITLYRPGAFAIWYRKNKNSIALDSQSRIERALHALANIRAL